MAIHAKKINPGATNNMVSFTGNIGATDLQQTVGGAPWDPTFSRIESVYNFSGADVTFGGHTFAPGSWKFSDVGGLVTTTTLTGAITGDARCLITLRT